MKINIKKIGITTYNSNNKKYKKYKNKRKNATSTYSFTC